MAYTALARRYRSRAFDELVGQEPIARTLRAAIDTNRVAHAYLFTGTRGVGKTSMARIFANALNNPANDTQLAQAIFSGGDIDTIEIDAASNTGVDNVRELIANAAYRPMRGRYKVYIIDEVHMLSTAAFNALLKTMEEPPDHVKFILCTTESHKVPATIQSRCQRYDFRSIPAARIVDHLREVLTAEQRDAEPQLLAAVARLGNGSMRDALSLLDRLLASGEPRLTVDHLEQMLGLPQRDLIARLVHAFASASPPDALTLAADILARGIGPDQLLDALTERLRDLLVLRVCGDATHLVELSDDARRDDAALARHFDPASLVYMIAVAERVQRDLKASSAPRALLDAALVRLALTDRFADAASLATRPAATDHPPAHREPPTPHREASTRSTLPGKR